MKALKSFNAVGETDWCSEATRVAKDFARTSMSSISEVGMQTNCSIEDSMMLKVGNELTMLIISFIVWASSKECPFEIARK